MPQPDDRELCVLWPWLQCEQDCPPCPDRQRKERIWAGIQQEIRRDRKVHYSQLVTTIVAGVLALALITSLTVLLITGEGVPSYFEPLLAALIGVAIGGANKASG